MTVRAWLMTRDCPATITLPWPPPKVLQLPVLERIEMPYHAPTFYGTQRAQRVRTFASRYTWNGEPVYVEAA